jgi:magnesium transporter
MSEIIPVAGSVQLERIHDILDSGALRAAVRLLDSLAPAEIAHVLESLPPAQRELLWGLIRENCDGEVLLSVTDEVRAELTRDMSLAGWLAASGDLDLDDLAELVRKMPDAVTRQVINALDEQHRKRLESVLAYPEDTAGGLMNPDTVTVRPEVTLDVVARYLRRLGEQMPDGTDKLFVVNRDDHYLGVLPLWRLVSGKLEQSVAEVMSLDVAPLPAAMSASQVAQRFEAHDLLSAPVVDEAGCLLGRVTIDDVVDIIREEGEHQLLGQVGLSESEDMFAPVWASTRRRATWLGVNLLTALLASWVIGRFELALSQMVALAVLMPIVASMGGIAGSQTLTLAIRGIALGQLSAKNMPHLIWKELAVGAVNSLIWATVIAVLVALWFASWSLAVLIGVAMTINLLFAVLFGAFLPLLLDRLGIDPALAGSVLLTTVTDVVGFIAFLGLATLFLL